MFEIAGDPVQSGLQQLAANALAAPFGDDRGEVKDMGVCRPVGGLDATDRQQDAAFGGDEELPVIRRVTAAQGSPDALGAIAFGVGKGVDQQRRAIIAQGRAVAIQRRNTQTRHARRQPLIRGGGAACGRIPPGAEPVRG